MLFVGSSHGPEGGIARESDIPFKAVPSSPLTKSLSLKNMASLAKLGLGVFRARSILRSFRPDVVVGTGGYTTAAVLLAARSLGLPIVIHEQNAVPGRTNTWLARMAGKVCVSLESSAAFFPEGKVVVTGMPVRREFRLLPDKKEARRALGLDENAFTIVVVGGSQGAVALNKLVSEMWPMIDDGSTQVLHQLGKRNYEECKGRESKGYRVEAYLDMPLAIAAADLFIGRSGASSIAEVTAAGLPSVLIPYPYAYADHQTRNAEEVEAQGAAVVYKQDQVTAQILAEKVRELRSTDKLSAMAAASRAVGKPDAADRVAEVVLGLARD